MSIEKFKNKFVDYICAEKNLANAKYDYILANLRLALAAGTIDPGDIIEINNLLN